MYVCLRVNPRREGRTCMQCRLASSAGSNVERHKLSVEQVFPLHTGALGTHWRSKTMKTMKTRKGEEKMQHT